VTPRIETKEIRPQAGPQTAFLATPADIAVYGGSAGGGKTYGLALEPLRHVANPHFGAVIFRRTSPQITSEGGLWDEASKIYPLTGAVGLVGSLDWRFPSGANVSMRHLQHEKTKYDWQGSQVPLICFDELTHFTEGQFFYMLSRSRSTCGVRPYVRATTNPDPTSWVKQFLAQWVDKTHPDPAASGEIRWFIRHKGKLVWGRTKAELQARFPGKRPKSVTFIRASVFDNKILLTLDPDYLANLQALPDVERARLLDGDWDVMRDGLVYPGFGAIVVPRATRPEGTLYGGMDFGFNDPFAAPWAVLDHDDVLWVYGLRYQSWCTLPEHSAALPEKGVIRWFADPSRPDSIAELRIAGHDVVPCVHLGTRPLLTGIDRVTHRIKTNRLKVIAGSAPDLVREATLYHYPDDRSGEEPVDRDNHSMDALRYLVTGIDRGRAVPPPPPATPEEAAARELAEKAAEEKARQEARAEFTDIDNEHWWGG
jgi:hypothetical protein